MDSPGYSKLTEEYYDSNSFNVGNYKWYLFMNYDQLSWLFLTPLKCLSVCERSVIYRVGSRHFGALGEN